MACSGWVDGIEDHARGFGLEERLGRLIIVGADVAVDLVTQLINAGEDSLESHALASRAGSEATTLLRELLLRVRGQGSQARSQAETAERSHDPGRSGSWRTDRHRSTRSVEPGPPIERGTTGC